VAVQESGIRGEIDHFSAPAFRDALIRAIDGSANPLVAIDLAGVTFMDSAGYGAIVEANEHAVRTDRLLVIRNLSRSCTKVVRLCDYENELLLENDAPRSN
jgi:anti-anti-sigma factor